MELAIGDVVVYGAHGARADHRPRNPRGSWKALERATQLLRPVADAEEIQRTLTLISG